MLHVAEMPSAVDLLSPVEKELRRVTFRHHDEDLQKEASFLGIEPAQIQSHLAKDLPTKLLIRAS